MHRAPWVLAFGLALGSCAVAPFACDDDAQCRKDDVRGSCELGWCAYPDDDCPSGARFSKNAGDGHAKRCVDAAASSSSSGDSTS